MQGRGGKLDGLVTSTSQQGDALLRRFCLSLEEHRRTTDGRVRTSEEFLAHFFPHDEEIVADQILRLIPKNVRGPIIAGWGVRGLKAALTDDDAKVEEVVHDAVLAGDIDHVAFETALTPVIVIEALPLTEWWMFWRSGKLTGPVVQKAILTAFDLGLFEAEWFFATLAAPDGEGRGIDVFAPRLSNADLGSWVKEIHRTGDASPKGILMSLGWEKIFEHTSTSAILMVLDQLVNKVGLKFELPAELGQVEDVETTVVQSHTDRRQSILEEKRKAQRPS